MRILIVAATDMEIASLAAGFTSDPEAPRFRAGTHAGHLVDALVTGVGMVATAAWCTRALIRQRYDLALNFGLCGSFDPAMPPGSVAHVVADRIAELGAEDDDVFLTIQELKLLGEDEFPFVGGQLVNATPPRNTVLTNLPAVDGITVNTVHGRDQSIAQVRNRFKPQIESMEGAAFMYSCLIAGVPFAQVRAVSNFVERRNRGAWNIDGAVEILGRTAVAILDRA